jgi:hypothetical protein
MLIRTKQILSNTYVIREGHDSQIKDEHTMFNGLFLRLKVAERSCTEVCLIELKCRENNMSYLVAVAAMR